MKPIHHLIVTSQAYRRASSGETVVMAGNRAIDPDNRLLWKANVQRLDAEVVRDSLLAAAGRLDLTQGGADIDFHKGEEVYRRSLYFRHAYEKQMTMLVLFDAASPNECYRRSESILPQQALALANSDLSRKMARELAAQLQGGNSKSSAVFVEAAFRSLLCRPPTDEERETCLTFLDTQAERLSRPSKLTLFSGKAKEKPAGTTDPQLRARENLIHVLMNHNDFVTVR